MNLPTLAGDAQIRFVLYEIVEAVEPGIRAHVTEEGKAGCAPQRWPGEPSRRWLVPVPVPPVP